MKTAYLIVICQRVSNSILGAEIWSEPEWEASQCIRDVHTYVAYSVKEDTFQKGIDHIIKYISTPKTRYHYLYEYLEKWKQRKLI